MTTHPKPLTRNTLKTQGATLIELILSIVIISIAFTGILTVMDHTTRHSADPIVQHQAIAIAESYLEEILLQPYSDPDGVDTETSRIHFDDVDDYNNLPDNKVRDQYNNQIATLTAYSVSVSVSNPLTLTGSVMAKQVSVTVSGLSTQLTLVGYRASY